MISTVAPGVTRIHPIAPPGVSRPGVRQLSNLWTIVLARLWLARRGVVPSAVVVSSPQALLPSWRSTSARRVYFATDDFVAGAEILGSRTGAARREQERNVAAADLVLAVTDELASRLSRPGKQARVLPNGCDPDRFMMGTGTGPAPDVRFGQPIAGLVGQLNERISIESLESVVSAGLNLLIVGPRYDVDPRFGRRLDDVLAHPRVQWVGRQPVERLPEYLAAMTVGLTPYADTPFNRASDPLKTLEYLAAGIPVVSTDLPSARRIGGPYVHLAGSSRDFGHLALDLASTPPDPERVRRSARGHSWAARAAMLEAMLAGETQP